MSAEETLRPRIEAAFADRKLLGNPDYRYAIEGTLTALDRGELRVASPPAEEGGEWTTHAWLKQAIILFFAIRKNEKHVLHPFEFHDKIPLRGYFDPPVPIGPPAVGRFGSFLESGCILMPSYVNIGARVGTGTMVDTWATVGSCAQIGSGVHLSGGVGIGGVL